MTWAEVKSSHMINQVKSYPLCRNLKSSHQNFEVNSSMTCKSSLSQYQKNPVQRERATAGSIQDALEGMGAVIEK